MRKLSLISLSVAAIGLLDALYLVAILNFGTGLIPVQWVVDRFNAVHAPQFAHYSYLPIVGIIPLPYVGAFCYGLMILALVKGWRKVALAISVMGFGMSVYLMSIQFGVIGVACPFCILSAASMTTLFVLNSLAYARSRTLPDASSVPAYDELGTAFA